MTITLIATTVFLALLASIAAVRAHSQAVGIILAHNDFMCELEDMRCENARLQAELTRLTDRDDQGRFVKRELP